MTNAIYRFSVYRKKSGTKYKATMENTKQNGERAIKDVTSLQSTAEAAASSVKTNDPLPQI